jgi:DNA-binding LytR/AlgR family response regulator
MDLVSPPGDSGPSSGAVFPARIAAVRDNTIVMLMPDEVRYAQSDGHVVWLQTDQGRLRAALPGFANVARRLLPLGFLRVHRRYVVNVGRIRQINRSATGILTLTTDEGAREVIPVSRRNEAEVRQVLGI